MKIENLLISNFRGIRSVELTELGEMVIIAGQNGSGKSCVFDAIRMLKSVYGGYQHNEFQQWMGEFAININDRAGLAALFNDTSRELKIVCDFKLADEERAYIIGHAEELLREAIWRTLLPEAYQWGGYRMAMFASQFRDREPEVAERVSRELPTLVAELAETTIRGHIFVLPGETLRLFPSMALSVVFSSFRPRHIGVIDYHGAQRHYGRENVQGINLNLDTRDQQYSQSALYNYSNKYTNVKSEMASSFVREILAQQAGTASTDRAHLTDTLQELFTSFFPDKRFLGPQPSPDGGLAFPVETADGSTHDLDELSAGEKEILYGYLRIRNSAPRHSIIFVDEPELHLNPRLIRGLPQFYRKHLGQALGNQIWLVTHSDALLREVVGRPSYGVFHMTPCASTKGGESQLKALRATEDLDLALIDLVGDLAAYRPGGKAVIFEGGGDSDFDQRLTARLFPQLQEQANLISGSNKVRVRALHEVLQRAYSKGDIPIKFFAITDKDGGADSTESLVNTFTWDVYHVENYLLEPTIIGEILSALGEKNALSTEEILDEMRDCAKATLAQMVRHRLIEEANQKLVRAIRVGGDPSAGDIGGEVHKSVAASMVRVAELDEQLSADALRASATVLEQEFATSLSDGTWKEVFRGRDILRRFASKWAPGVSYEAFRNLLIARMEDLSYQPPGMKRVIDLILTA